MTALKREVESAPVSLGTTRTGVKDSIKHMVRRYLVMCGGDKDLDVLLFQPHPRLIEHGEPEELMAVYEEFREELLDFRQATDWSAKEMMGEEPVSRERVMAAAEYYAENCFLARATQDALVRWVNMQFPRYSVEALDEFLSDLNAQLAEGLEQAFTALAQNYTDRSAVTQREHRMIVMSRTKREVKLAVQRFKLAHPYVPTHHFPRKAR